MSPPPTLKTSHLSMHSSLRYALNSQALACSFFTQSYLKLTSQLRPNTCLIAISVKCPLPVRASEPYKSTSYLDALGFLFYRIGFIYNYKSKDNYQLKGIGFIRKKDGVFEFNISEAESGLGECM